MKIDDRVAGERSRALSFADFYIDLGRIELRRSGSAIPIQRKPLDMLVYLAEHRGRVVPKKELLDRLWPGVSVSEHALTSALRDLRRTLGEEKNRSLIVTVRGRGYRFVGDVREHGTNGADGDWALRNAPSEALFVEREDVMRQLHAALRDAIAGSLRVSLLAGPAGIGKTQTALNLVRDARRFGVDVHIGRCSGAEGAPPFWPWLQVLRSCVTVADASQWGAVEHEALRRVGRVLPELAHGGPRERPLDAGPFEERFRLFDAVGVLLRARARVRPLLVFIDDLHAADEASLLLFVFLVQHLHDAPLHLVAALRDTEGGPDQAVTRALGTVAQQLGTERIDLGGLGAASVAEILRLAAGCDPPAAFVARVLAATGGNPFFVSEIARLVSLGQLEVCDGATIPLPRRVRDAIRIHLERRSADCVSLLGLAAVAGREFELLPVAHASGLPQDRVVELLDEAEAAGLVTATRARNGTYAFVHDLVREALYRDLSTGQRTRLHHRLARALESLTPDRHAEMAYHYVEAAADGAASEALAHSQRMAIKASSQTAYEDAVLHYDRALGVLNLVAGAPPDLRCRLLLAQAEAAWGTLEPAAAVHARFERAAEEARGLASADLLARAALGRTGFGASPGDYRDIGVPDRVDIDLLTQSSRALDGCSPALRALVLSRLALAVRYAREPSVPEQLSEEAVSIARGLGDPETLASVLRYRHEILSGPASVVERIDLARTVLHLARESQSTALELDALYFLSRDLFELGEIQAAAESGAAADVIAATMRHPGAHYRSGIRHVLILTLRGAFDVAMAKAREFFERDRSRNLAADGTVVIQASMIHMLRGEHENLIRTATPEAERRPAFRWTRYAIARSHAALGQVDRARIELERAAQDDFRFVTRDHTFLHSVLLLSDLCSAFGDVERARALYEAALPFESMIAAPYLATICGGAVSRALGILSHVAREYDRAERHFEKALAVERRMWSLPLMAYTLLAHGQMLVSRGRPADRDRARLLFGEAGEHARQLGMCEAQRLAAEGEVAAGCRPRGAAR